MLFHDRGHGVLDSAAARERWYAHLEGLPVDFLRQLGEAAWHQRTACIQGEIARLRAWCERHEIPWTPAGAA